MEIISRKMKIEIEQNRIQTLLEGKKGKILSIYYTAGFPKIDDTVRIGKSLSDHGADIIEIGIPFSDPVADGPVIQASNKVALDNGMNLKLLLEQTKQLRSQTEIPIVLMGYFNPLLQFGVEKFCQAAGEAGVDGLIIPDLPREIFVELYQDIFERHGLHNIFLVTPSTSHERLRQIDETSNSFIYVVSSAGTTGAKDKFDDESIQYFKRLKEMKLKNPFLIGFGISNSSAFNTACQFAKGAIIGSAFISAIESSNHLDEDILSFISKIKEQHQV